MLSVTRFAGELVAEVVGVDAGVLFGVAGTFLGVVGAGSDVACGRVRSQ